jgi:hypothetical protein
MTEITELIKKYEQNASVKDLAKHFGIHYGQGWSLARWARSMALIPLPYGAHEPPE